MSLYSEKDIEEMGFKELRLAVAEMRAELTKFKKLLEMINEDMESSAIGKTLSVENGKLKTQIEVLAGEISTKVSDEDMESAIEQMAGKITSQVIKDIDVSDAIKTELVPSNNGNFDTSTIYKYVEITEDSEGNEQEIVTYYYYNDVTEKWEEVTDFSLTSVFEQTAKGFKLKGDVQVDGSCILTESLTFDSSNKPLEVQYSADGVNDWHDTFNPSSDMFMRIKIGAEWSKAIKVVGSDGGPGPPGESGVIEAEITATAMFNALTNEGDLQGIFPVFVKDEGENGETQIFINAEMIAGKLIKGITIVSEDESGNVVKLNGGFLRLIDADGNGKAVLGMSKVGEGEYIPFMIFGAGAGSGSTTIEGIPYISGAMLMCKNTDGFYMTFTPQGQSNTQGIYFYDDVGAYDTSAHIGFGSSTVDFNGAKVTGLKVTFG